MAFRRDFLLPLAALCLLAGCSRRLSGNATVQNLPDKEINIVYESDVHCGVDGYATLAALRNDLKARTPYVATVSSGDFVQGDVVGAKTRGASIIRIMNAVGYDFFTLGNHEFDYGVPRLFVLMDSLCATPLCCNFYELDKEQLVFAPYNIVSYGNVRVAFIGFATPVTMGSVSYSTFRDDDGYLKYGFSENDFMENAQKYINKARADGADYVVALAHLGDEAYEGLITSLDLISGTTGIDVVLDGHAHHVIPDSIVCNLKGNPVILTSPGTKLNNIGVLTIGTNGKLSTRLVPTDSYTGIDQTVAALVSKEKETILKEGQTVCGNTPFELPCRDNEDKWLVRYQETPIANFFTDALRCKYKTEIGIVNGGGIRAGIAAGDITANDIFAIEPFGNFCCVGTISGRQLMDALEFGARLMPLENGDLLQVSGIRYEVDCSVTTHFQTDADGLFTGVPEGSPRRVSNLQVLDASTGLYQPVDPDRRYSIASTDYLMMEAGCYGILERASVDERTTDLVRDVISEYLRATLNGVMPGRYSRTEGRITVRR